MEDSIMKMTYQQPMLRVVKIQATHLICSSGPVQRASSNAGINETVEAGDGPARVKGYSVWDDEF
jgi:hypothetical protein